MVTINFQDAMTLSRAVASVGGTMPKRLGNLLSSYEVLSAPVSSEPPEKDILTHALDGTLDQKTLAKLVPIAAAAERNNIYQRELARNNEHVLLGEFHRQLKAGAVDEILDSIRPAFNRAAEKIAEAKAAGINAESTPEQVIEAGTPGLAEAWRNLPTHLAVVGKVASIASQFGVRPNANFQQLVEYPQAYNHTVSDYAVMCTTGGLVADSQFFLKPDQGHRSSPFFRCGGLKLHSIEEAEARYNAFAADEFDRVHSGPRGGRLIDGEVVEDPRPVNPYRRQEGDAA